MRLAEAIESTGLTKYQIYHAIDKKWIMPLSKGRDRVFSDFDVAKLKIIYLARVLNLPENEIPEILDYFTKHGSIPINTIIKGENVTKFIDGIIKELGVF